MADIMQFELVSPERKLASIEVNSVRIPGTEGDMTAMADHMPLITTLRPGIVVAEGPSGTEEYFVTGGFAEISAKGASVLAELAMPKAEVTAEQMQDLIEKAQSALEQAPPENKDAAAKLAADMSEAYGALGL